MERLFCLGRPIIDVTASIKAEFLSEIGVDENLQGEISNEKMEKILGQLSKKSDYIFISAGGVESNVAINSALLGIPSIIVGSIGDDYFHLIFKDGLGFIDKLDMSLISTMLFNSAVVVVIWIIKDGGEKKRIKVLNYGVSGYLPWNSLAKSSLKSATMFFSSLFTANTPQTELIWKSAIRIAKKFGKKIIINLGGVDTIQDNKLRSLLNFVRKYADVVFMNEQECEFLLTCYKKEAFLIFPEVEQTIITRGGKDISIFLKGEEIFIQITEEGRPAQGGQIFEIGAGDAFCAGYVFALSRGANPKEAARFAIEISLIKIKCPESHLTKTNLACIEERRRKYALNE
ncbi:hypothetical protein A2567_00130 [Candidatus Azambacteria bacterium RIFOXYD1_FULL_42_11]|uniref:Carbohydrate kinase PfkB domain-containing protein n=1 Tax=Candidatus Azambacteria bacterium RIFOXYD1_FULL_42_11 TaxID=1797310 RepID=A0A1F5CH98_9BACT|nr:MAG: hypothetical protein A2567_00130 [Candidatus Azambacteria bacterium RIFOXYD1_FULL_42_11]